VRNVLHKEDIAWRRLPGFDPAQFIPEAAELVLNDVAHVRLTDVVR
jgi:hypothetical protein